MSHENVEAVVDYAHKYMGLTTDTSEWRETAREEEKGPYGEDYDHITYTHTSGVELHAVSHVDDGDEWGVVEGGTLLYDICEDTSMGAAGYSQFGAVFCPKSFWERNHYLMLDEEHEHQAVGLMLVHGMPSALADDEVEEGQFALPMHIKTMSDAHNYLQKLGYEYTDMTTVRSAPPGTASTASAARSAADATAADIITKLIEDFETGALRPVEDDEDTPKELYLGQTIADALAEYDWGHGVESVLIYVLEKEGIPDPLHNVFAWADRDDILGRLQTAAKRKAAIMPAQKALPAIEEAKKWAETPPADIEGKDMSEVYRLAIRGKIPQIAAIGWCFDDERKGGATEEELGWYCGYVGHDGRLVRDLYIPDHVFEGWFPEYRKATWNDYEPKDKSNYHTMPIPDEQYVEGVRALIASRYIDRGCVQVDDMVEPVVVPLVPTSTMTPTRPVGAGYTASGVSKIETLNAYPPGHTGVAPPVGTASPAPAAAPAPTSVGTATGTEALWREYQLDIEALKSHGIQRAGYQVVDTTPSVVFALGFLDEAGGIVDLIPQQEIVKLFSEYRVECLDDGITYKISKLFGQSLSDLEKVVRERLQGVNIFDAAA